MSDNENDWGAKKNEYYEKAKDSDSDFIEEEKEAIKLQQKKLKKLKDVKMFESESDQDDDAAKKESEGQILFKKNKYNIAQFDEDEDDKIENTHNKPSDADNESDTIQLLNNIMKNIEEVEENLHPVIEILKNENLKIPKTISYLKYKKDMHSLYTVYLLYYLIYKQKGKLSDHHPIVKKMLYVKALINEMNEPNENIFANLDKILKLIEANKIKEEENEDEIDDEDDDELEEEDQNISRLNKKIISNKKNSQIPDKLLGKKQARDFINENTKKFEQLKNQKEKHLIDKKVKLAQEIENKNQKGQHLSNDKVLKAKGITRKRPKWKGNAKLNNRFKFDRKQKLRKQMVKEYKGKPEVYGGESHGIRRDLIQSTKIR
jgi:hypothetical protein